MQIPDFTLQLAAPGGSCRTVRLRDQAPRDNRSGWQKFTLSLQQFDWRNSNPDPNSGNAFGGCSDSVNDWSVDTLMIQNAWGGDQYLCIDQVCGYGWTGWGGGDGAQSGGLLRGPWTQVWA